MKLFKLTAAFSVLVMTTSCDPSKQFETEIQEIDSCITVIDEMEERLEGIKFDSLMIMVDHVKMNEDRMEMYYKPDTLNEDLGKLMNECKGIRKNMTDLKGKKSYFADEMNAVKYQFKTLKEDVKNGVYEKEEIDQYLAKEKTDLEVVSLTFNDFDRMQKSQSDRYYYAVPKVDAYLKEMIGKSDTVPQ